MGIGPHSLSSKAPHDPPGHPVAHSLSSRFFHNREQYAGVQDLAPRLNIKTTTKNKVIICLQFFKSMLKLDDMIICTRDVHACKIRVGIFY